MQQYQEVRSRYKFLVVHGASGTGKTIFCKWLMKDASNVLEVNCASCPEPDLRKYTPGIHEGILFDEASCSLVLKQKKLFQSPPVPVELGCSTTNCHAYSVWVHGRQLMICSNTWVGDLQGLQRAEDREWLGKNSILLDVRDEPMYQGAA